MNHTEVTGTCSKLRNAPTLQFPGTILSVTLHPLCCNEGHRERLQPLLELQDRASHQIIQTAAA